MEHTKIEQRNRPLPELFRRNDIRNAGGWDVDRARAVRGEPYISVGGRIMRVPLDDSELAQAIRGHEQVHCKISPQDIDPYVNAVVSENAIRSAEEARVNFVAAMLGFPMDALVTGSETFDGENIVMTDNWSGAVFHTANCVHTGSLNPFLTGVRRQNTAWADALRAIATEITRFQKKQLSTIKQRRFGKRRYLTEERKLEQFRSCVDDFCSTSVQGDGTLEGMQYTTQLAFMLESMASRPPIPPRPKQQEEKQEENGPAVGRSGDGDFVKDEEHFDRAKMQEQAKKLLKAGGIGTGEWLPITIKKHSCSVVVPGALGRTRTPSPVGRNPRHITRLLTDPQRRIFDRQKKAPGGVVLIDCSGSMRLRSEKVKEIMMAAPGCTVCLYANTYSEESFHIVAEKGKMVAKLPRLGGGNGNDLTAIKKAVAMKRHDKEPVIWVTDGQVYYPNGNNLMAQVECAKFVKTNKVHMEYDPDGAIRFLNGLKDRPFQPDMLPRWKETNLVAL